MVSVSFSAKCNFLVLQLMGTRNFVRWIFVACQQVILAILQRILTGFFFKCYLYYPKRAPRCSVSCFFPRNASWDIVYLSLKRGLVLEWFAPSNSWHIISQMSLDMYIYINETCQNFFWNCALLDVRAKSSFKCLKFDGSFCAELPPFKGVICAISPSALHPTCFPSPLLWRRGYWSSLLGGRCWRTWRLEG